jgi:hypothetical protein
MIKKILISGGVVLGLIWGIIFYLTLTDSSYQLFMPQISNPASSNQAGVDTVDLNQEGPWKQDLFMESGDGSSYGGTVLLAHGAATPSAILKNNDMVVYFSFFPKDQRRLFGQIYWVKSSDGGNEWSQPAAITIENLPTLAFSPFSAKAMVLPTGQIKLYFLSKKAGEAHNKLLSAVSEDGARFIYDPSVSFEIENESLNSFTMAMLDDKLHLIAYTEQGSQTNNAYHAISYDGNVFTRLADIKIADATYGQSSLIEDNGKLRLIGSSPKGLWSSTSGDGNSWSTPTHIDHSADNPALLKTGDTYRIFYTDTAAAEQINLE